LKLGVSYTLWVPDGTRPLRAVIVHQHGCGEPACKGGSTAAYDLHWQALARKWNCALLGPYYHQGTNENCALWSDPKKGSELTFLKCLADFAQESGHPELMQVPWCLWGHSGGGYWAAEMQLLHPQRIVAIWLRSGASKLFQKSQPETRDIPAAFYQVPVMCNPGVKEKNDRFARIWEGMVETFRSGRAKGAPVGFAPDPRTSHECGDSRYLAIPFFDACLALRLPKQGQTNLRPAGPGTPWTGAFPGTDPNPAGSPELEVWLPSHGVRKAWMEYVKMGAVSDDSPPAAPFNVRKTLTPTGVELTWEAEADFESGLGGFIVERDGKEIGRMPEKPVGRFGRPLFQTMSYHDTPEAPLPEMRFTDRDPVSGRKHAYRVVALNSVGLASKPSRVAREIRD
jgi:hypothetical protein